MKDVEEAKEREWRTIVFVYHSGDRTADKFMTSDVG